MKYKTWKCLLLICVPLLLAILLGWVNVIDTAKPGGGDDPREADDNMRRIQAGFQEILDRTLDVALTVTEITGTGYGKYPLDVRVHGAKGDGVTDDTAAFVAAIAAGAGGTVYLPNGTYYHTGLTINQKIRFFMEPGATLFLINGSNTPSIIVTTAGVIIEGGTIDGNRTNQDGTHSSSAITITADGVTVKNAIIDDHDGMGINARDVDDLKVHDCTIIDTFWPGVYVQGVTGPIDNIEITNNSVDRSAIASSLAGILVYGEDAVDVGTNIRITENYVKETVGAADSCITGRYLRDVTVGKNNVTGGFSGITIDRSSKVTQIGNTCYNHKYTGIEMAGQNDSITTGNTINGNSAYTNYGIVISGPGFDQTRNIVSNNTITGIKKHPIYTLDDADYCSIIGNNIEHSPTVANNAAISITFSDHYVCSLNIIKGDGVTTIGIYFGNAGPGTCNGNEITNINGRGIVIYADDGAVHDDFVITGNCLESTTGVGLNLHGGSTLGDNIIINNNSNADYKTLDNSGTPAVFGARFCLTGGIVAITDLDEGITNQLITILAEHNITITDGTNIFLSGSANWAMTASDTLTLICKADNKWYEIGRGNN